MAAVKQSDLGAFALLPDPVWVFDFDNNQFWYANHLALDLFSVHSLDELRVRYLRDLMTDGTRRRITGLFQRFRQGEFMDEEWTFYPDGKAPVPTKCTCSGIEINDDFGPRLAMLVQARPRKVNDNNERRFVEALQHCNDCLSLYTKGGQILLRNPAAEQAFGVGASEQDVFAGSFASQEDAKTARTIAESGGVFKKRITAAVAEGQAWYDTEVRLVVDPSSGSKALLSVQHDVTEEYVNQLRLDAARCDAEELRGRAEAASDAKSLFLAAMSHDLRTPMTGVLAAAELLSTSDLDVDQRELLEMVVEGGEQMVAFVDDILDLSHIEAGRIELTPQTTTFEQVITSTLQPLRAPAQRKGLKLEYQILGNNSDRVDVDVKRLRLVLTNLVSNAIQFSDSGTVTLAVSSYGTGARRFARFEVSDEGVGIDLPARESLFDPLHQGQHQVTETGSGLGLHIARSIVEAMGGSTGVKHTKGKGSTFWVELQVPLAKAPVELLSAARPKKNVSVRVLVVDDNSLNRRAMSRVLMSWGCEVTTAVDGQDALERLDASFDVVLMDINMPRKDGVCCAREIRARGDALAEIPIIAMTADVFFQEQNDTFNQTLNKPLDWEALRVTLYSLTRIKQLMRPIALQEAVPDCAASHQ